MLKLYSSIGRENLYNVIDNKIISLGFAFEDYPLSSKEIVKKFHPEIHFDYWEFSSTKICGMLSIGKHISTVVLNSKRDEKGQNFDLMHELIHYWFHPRHNGICIYNDEIKQSRNIEWQANEGAAQALMPRDLFIHKYYEYSGSISELSHAFYVGECAVEYRIRNLKKEIKSAMQTFKPKKSRQELLSSFAPWSIKD